MENTLNLKRILIILRRRLKLAILVTLITALVVLGMSIGSLVTKYKYQASFLVKDTASYQVGDTTDKIAVGQQLSIESLQIFVNDVVIGQMKSNLNLNYGNSTIRSFFGNSQIEKTNMLTIVVNYAQRDIAKELIDEMVKIAPVEVEKQLPNCKLEQLTPVTFVGSTTTPDLKSSTEKGILLGLALSLILICLLEAATNKIKPEENLTVRYKLPIIAEILFRKTKREHISAQCACVLGESNMQSQASEAYKTARVHLTALLRDKENKALVFTSHQPLHEKCAACVNTALSFAYAGASVVVVDANLCRPKLHTLLGMEQKNGLADILNGTADIAEVTRMYGRSGLSVITAGEATSVHSELLASEKMCALIENLRSRFDYVFIVAPPVGSHSDALELSDAVGGFVLVVRDWTSTHEEIENSLNEISLTGGKAIGFIRYGEFMKKTQSKTHHS